MAAGLRATPRAAPRADGVRARSEERRRYSVELRR